MVKLVLAFGVTSHCRIAVILFGFQENSSTSVASFLRKTASSSSFSRDLDQVTIPDVPNVSGKQLSVWQCYFMVWNEMVFK